MAFLNVNSDLSNEIVRQSELSQSIPGNGTHDTGYNRLLVYIQPATSIDDDLVHTAMGEAKGRGNGPGASWEVTPGAGMLRDG